MRVTGLAKILGSIAVASLLAACSGGHSSGIIPGVGTDSSAQSQSVHAPAQGDAVAPMSEASKGKCETSGKGIAVNPCIVTFTLLDLAPKNVKVKTKKNAQVSESDNCQAEGIATISGGDSSFTVTPGLIPGTCTATFSAKRGTKKLGSATLTVNNQN